MYHFPNGSADPFFSTNTQFVNVGFSLYGRSRFYRRFMNEMGELKSKSYYYARVSTKEQNLDRQLAAFRELGADERDIICDKESGKDLDRPGYRMLRDYMLRSGDTLVIKSLDRLSRRKEDIKNELRHFREMGVRVKIIDLPTSMIEVPAGQEWVLDMVNNILIEVLGTIAEQERETTLKRQAEGIAAAREKGVDFGRPKIEYPSDWAQVYVTWKSGGISARMAMERLGLKKTTFYKLVREYERRG